MCKKNKILLVATFFMLAPMLFPIICLGQPVKIFTIDTRGKTGAQVGTELGNLLKDTYPDYNATINNSIVQTMETITNAYNTFYSTNKTAQELFDELMLEAILEIKNPANARIEPRLIDEVNAIANALVLTSTSVLDDGLLSENEFWCYQLAFDYLRLWGCTGFGVFGDHSVLSSPIVGRNLDMQFNTETLFPLAALTVYINDTGTFVNAGFAGSVSSTTGFNSQGLFGAAFDISTWNPNPKRTSKRSVAFDLRYAIESGTIISDVHEFMKDKLYVCSHNLLLADTTEVKVHEHPMGETQGEDSLPGRLRTWDSEIIISWGGKKNMVGVVNAFLLPPGKPWRCPECPPDCIGSGEYYTDNYYHTDNCDPDNPEPACYNYYLEDCDGAAFNSECFNYCASVFRYYHWPGNPLNLEDDYAGYYPMPHSPFSDVLQPIWDRLIFLATFTANNQNDKATIKDVIEIMTDRDDPSAPIAQENTALTMVFVPEQLRFFMYAVPADTMQYKDNPVLIEYGVLVPVDGDVNNDLVLDMDDAILSMQVVCGLPAKGLAQPSDQHPVGDKIDTKNIIHVLQRISGIKY